MPASIVTLVIILVEGGLLRWRIKQITFGGALWRSAVINIASSVIGSMLLLLAYGRDSYFMWDTMSLVVPLFIITVAAEIPLLYFLFKQLPMTVNRACILGFGINLASYAVVFVMEIGLFLGFISYAGHLDRKERTAWQDPILLKQVTGLIYATESKGIHHSLRVFDPQVQTWRTLTNCPSIDPNKWDVKGQVCTFVRRDTGDEKENNLVISRLPDFSVLHEIGFDSFVDPKSDSNAGWQGITDIALSPNVRYLAILFRFADAVAFKDDSSYYDLGGRCRLVVFDVNSGKEIARAPRWASDSGLCWLPDARMVLFPSFDDEKLYETTRSVVRGSTSYGVGYSKDGKFSQSIFAFNLDTGGVARFSVGSNPSLAARKRQILVRDDSTLRLLDLSG